MTVTPNGAVYLIDLLDLVRITSDASFEAAELMVACLASHAGATSLESTRWQAYR